MMDLTQWSVVYSAGRRSRRVRALFWVSLSVAVPLLVYAWHLAREPDGAAWASVLAAFVLASVVALLLYVRCYVVEIAYLDQDRRRLRIRTLAPTSSQTRIVSAGDIRSVKRFDGDIDAAGHRTPTPWLNLRLRSRLLPLVIDLRGDFSSEARSMTVLRSDATGSG